MAWLDVAQQLGGQNEAEENIDRQLTCSTNAAELFSTQQEHGAIDRRFLSPGIFGLRIPNVAPYF
jgi:hypothetical protein